MCRKLWSGSGGFVFALVRGFFVFRKQPDQPGWHNCAATIRGHIHSHAMTFRNSWVSAIVLIDQALGLSTANRDANAPIPKCWIPRGIMPPESRARGVMLGHFRRFQVSWPSWPSPRAGPGPSPRERPSWPSGLAENPKFAGVGFQNAYIYIWFRDFLHWAFFWDILLFWGPKSRLEISRKIIFSNFCSKSKKIEENNRKSMKTIKKH